MQNSSTASLQSEAIAILSGLLGGLRYGAKIRAPHSFVITFLFRRDVSTKDKLKLILRSTSEHSVNLGCFAALYKVLLFILKWVSVRLRQVTPNNSFISQRFGIDKFVFLLLEGTNKGSRLIPRPPGIPERAHHAALAGAFGGYLVWGKYTAINNQILFYLTSRLISGMACLARENGIQPFSWNSMESRKIYPFKAAVIWAIIMVLYEAHPDVLQSSLKKSMDEIYRRDLLSNVESNINISRDPLFRK